jgi:Cof subfamily protein (haloacid dehalogenase superfamily)
MIDCKLICSDVDGTLVSHGGEISEENRSWIRRVVEERHIPFAIVSGRFRSGVTILQEQLGIPVALCCFNGAYVEVDGKCIVSEPITISQAKSIVEIAKRYCIECIVFDRDQWYVAPDSEWYAAQYAMYKQKGRVGDLIELLDGWELSGHPCYKVIPKSRDPEKLALLRQAMECELSSQLHIFASSPVIIETARKNVDKANVIPVLSSYYHISSSQVMAFGDYDNDFGMLKAAGFPVAMGNGTDEIKRVACYVTDDNLHDGVAKAISHFFFCEKL